MANAGWIFRPLSRTAWLVYLTYPVILAVLLLMFTLLPASMSDGQEGPPRTVTYLSAYAFQAYQWSVFPARIVHENPLWMRPGATIHYSNADFVIAGAVSIGIWTAVFLLVVVPLRYFRICSGAAQQSSTEAESAGREKSLES